MIAAARLAIVTAALAAGASLAEAWGGDYAAVIVALAISSASTMAWMHALDTRVLRCPTGCDRCGTIAAPPIARLERWEARKREQLRSELKASILTRVR